MAARPAPKQDERPLAVVVEDLHKRFGELEVLKGVSLEAREGDVVSMIGASGSGKSTFLRCINFLEMPTKGRIVVTGDEVALKPNKDGNLHPSDRRQLERSPHQARHGVPEFQSLAAFDGDAERDRGSGACARGSKGGGH